jgi:periplasmic copper chaperone A
MRRVGRPGGVVAVATGLALVGACTAPGAVDARITNPVRQNSVNASVGHLRLLATRVEAPDDAQHLKNGNVGLFTTLANDGTSADRLVGVSTVYARQVVYRVGEGAESTISVTIPAMGVASMQYPGGPHLELVDLKVDVAGSRFIPVTFRFENNGSLTMNVFVEGFGFPTVSPPTTSRS